MRITNASLHLLSLPLARPMVAAEVLLTERPILWLSLRSDSGEQVWSECVALPEPGYSSETQDVAWDVLVNELLPSLKNRSFSHPNDVSEALDWVVPGYFMSKAAIEMAFWSLYAVEKGEPLWRVLGGGDVSVPGGVVLGIADAQALMHGNLAMDAVSKYPRVTLKIKPGYDFDYVKHMRAVLPDGVALAVDANGAFSESDMPMLLRLGELGLAFIEQPFERGRHDLHCHLNQRSQSPVALDESIVSMDDLEIALQEAAMGVLNLKAGRVGGFTVALEMLRRCQNAGVRVKVGGMYESGVGKAYNLALASVCGDVGVAHDISDSVWHWNRSVLRSPFAANKSGFFAINQSELYGNILVDDTLKMSLKNEILTL